MSVGSLCYMPEVLTCYTSTRYACAQSRPTLCNPTTEACQVPVRGIFQAWTLKQVAISYFRGSSWPRDQTCISCTSCIGSCLLYHCTTWEAPKCQLYLNTKNKRPMMERQVNYMKVFMFSCVQLFANLQTVAHQAPLSRRILQARILEWVAIPFSRGSSWSWDQTQSPADSLLSEPLGKPLNYMKVI